MNLRIVVRAVIENDQRRILLACNKDSAFWYPPGGGWIFPESLPECAKREVLEETGIEADIGPLLYVQEFYPQGKNRVDLEFFFLARHRRTLAGGPREPGAVVEFRWFSVEEMEGLAVYPEEVKQRRWTKPGPARAVGYLGVRRETVDGN